MTKVKFTEVNFLDSEDYIFMDKRGNQYHLFADGSGVKNISPDFWDKFFFCEKINIDYVNQEGKNMIKKLFHISKHKNC